MKSLTINYHPTLYTLGFDWTFDCQHASTSPEMVERIDEYMEAVTGIMQPIYYEHIETCDDCNAWRYDGEEEWRDE